MFSLVSNCFTWIKRRREPIKKVTLLMIGLDNAGKTCTVADLKGDSLDGITPTVGFLSSSFSMYRFNVTMYDLGGGSRIRGIWRNYFSEVYGIVFVVDASDRQRLDECRDVLSETISNSRISGKPLLILANKQDITGALSEEEVYQSLDLGTLTTRHKCPCQVFSCTAILGQGNQVDKQIKKGFQWLLSEVSRHFPYLSQRVERDSAEQKRTDAEERKLKFERVKKQREDREKAEKAAADKADKLEEDSDDDVVVGKETKGNSPTPNVVATPEPTKTKKRKSKKQINTIETLSDNPSPINDESLTPRENINHFPRKPTPLGDLDERLTPRGKLAPLEPLQLGVSEDAEGKRKKRRKKKRKTNKTAPIDEDLELPHKEPAPLAWGTQPSTMNGFPGSGGGTLSRRLEPLSQPICSDSTAPASTIAENDEDPKLHAPIRNKSWTRTRPNSEDHDVIT